MSAWVDHVSLGVGSTATGGCGRGHRTTRHAIAAPRRLGSIGVRDVRRRVAGTGPIDPSRTRPSPRRCVQPCLEGRLDAGAVVIELLSDEDVTRHRAALSALLRNAVDSGASVGFLPPLAEAEADAYWRGVVAAVREGSCLLLVAHDAEGGADAPGGRSSAPPSCSWRRARTRAIVPRWPR